MSEFYNLNPEHTNPRRIRAERDEARLLKRSPWWAEKLAKAMCEYCGKATPASDLTMDHRIPLARGGRSEKRNLAAACSSCNQAKKLKTPVELLLDLT